MPPHNYIYFFLFGKMHKKTDRYFKWKFKESPICRIFQDFIEDKKGCKTYLEARKDPQAPVDFIGRFYDKETNKTIVEVAVEVRSLQFTKEEIRKWYWYIAFPISKLNELMKFWRMGKEVYIVYLLKDQVFFLNWDYYLTHNFEIIKTQKGNYILKLPILSFKLCWEFNS